jgi:transglutaminase-like putative cysteine protease
MRIKLTHRIAFGFAEPARSLTYILKLTPRSHDGQRVMRWRIDIEPECRLKAREDHFGNLTHTLTIPGPVLDPRVTVSGEIANYDVAGVVRGSAERLPVDLFLRETALTEADSEIRAFAERVIVPAADRIGNLHRLMDAVAETIVADPERPMVDAAEAFAAGRGNSEDLTHIFLACARHLGWPARCVTGYNVPPDGPQKRHAWAEVHVEDLGWVAFDPTHAICPQDMHIRTAVGLDALDAAGLRGTLTQGMREIVEASWRFDRDRPVSPPAQGQSQGLS